MMWFGCPWNWHGGWFGLEGVGMMLFWFLGFVLLIIGMIYISKWLFYTVWRNDRRYRRYSDNEESLKILKRRYANGEINREEYEKMKKDLGF